MIRGGAIADNTEPIPGKNLVPWHETVVPMSIAQQPASQLVVQSRKATFTVQVAGYPAYTGVQWYRDSLPIVGANSLTYTITYQLIVKRGDEAVTNTTQVAAISGVTEGWNLLDNFDRYAIGALPGPWGVTGPGIRIVDVQGNHLLTTPGVGFLCALPLGNLTVKEGQQRTLFSRFYLPQDQAANAIDQLMGLSDKGIRFWSDYTGGDLGPDVVLQNPSANLQIGTRNGYNAAVDFSDFALQPQNVYNLWIDIQNDPIADGDLFTVFIALDGDTNRTKLFEGYRSDRNPNDTGIMGPTLPDLDTLTVGANTSGSVVCFDDFYLSKSAYNDTVPRAYGFTTPVTIITTKPTLKIAAASGNVVVSWSSTHGSSWILKGANSLTPPISWSPVTQPVILTGGNHTVTIPVTKAYEFYQLVE